MRQIKKEIESIDIRPASFLDGRDCRVCVEKRESKKIPLNYSGTLMPGSQFVYLAKIDKKS